jgi:hypothetical protein
MAPFSEPDAIIVTQSDEAYSEYSGKHSDGRTVQIANEVVSSQGDLERETATLDMASDHVKDVL